MEYTTPTLRTVGTAQALVLGKDGQMTDHASSFATSSVPLDVIGLDD
jgi:hypothetical protein